MKKLLLSILTLVLLLGANTIFSQTPNSTINLGILESFEAYTGAGGVANGAGGIVNGDVGTNLGIISGFTSPPYTGNTYNANVATDQARKDLLRLYIHLNDKFVDFPGTSGPAFVGTLTPGIYSTDGAGSLGALTLDGGGNPNAFFIIKFNGALTVGAGAVVTLTGGTQSSNVFYIANGAISIAAGANLKGNLFSKVGAVGLGANVILEGRMLTMAGAITIGVDAVASPPPSICTIPIFCEGVCSAAPAVNVLGVLSNFALYTSLGAIANTGISGMNGDIGTDGAISGYTNGVHIGNEQTANALTAQAAIDLDIAYNALMALPNTVINHAAAFGIGETINAGVYFVDGAGSLGGTITLDAQNNPNSIFVFKFAGAFNVAALSKIILANGARRCNVFWIGGAGVPTGAVNIGAASIMKGTFLSHGGACNSGAGVFLSGRQFSTSGAVNTDTAVIYANPECVTSITLKTTAVTDSPSVAAGATTPSVINNDISKGVQAVIGSVAGQVTLTFTNTATLTMNPDGTITVEANASAGTYPITYTICEVSNPTICSTVTSNVTVTAPNTIWTGTTSNAWNDVTNWSSGVPLSGGAVEIPEGLINYPVLDQARSIGNVSIATGATLSLNNFNLEVLGAFSGMGTFIGGGAASGLTFNGSGNRGTFYMNQTTPGTSNKIGNFTLNAAATGSATLGNPMSISGKLTLTNGTFNTGGNLTLTSNGSGTAVVAPITDCFNVKITGDVTVERYFPGNLRSFRLISSPVTTSTSIKDNWQEGQNNTATAYANNQNSKPGYGTHITGSTTGLNGFDATETGYGSMFTYNNTTPAWAAVPNTNSSTITAGVPYRLMIRGSRAINMDTNAPTADNTILRAKGALKICDASAGTLSQGADGFSFIGNPYQATVNIKDVLQNSTNLRSNFYYVWDPKVSTRGAYVAYDLDSNINPLGASSSVNQYLQPWQACFIQTTAAGAASILFKESNKSPLESVNENVFRTTSLASYIRLTLYESNTLASNGAAADGLIVKFGDNYVNAIDGYDALKFNNLDETFSTKNNTSLLGIESRLFPIATDIIPLNISQYRFTNYTMVANGTNMTGLPAYLHDRLLQTYTEIPQSGSVNYSYVLDTTNPATSALDRFRIVFQNSTLSIGSNTALAFTMYPNPSKQGVFDIVMNDATEDTKLVIYNTIGQEVYATNLTKTTINHINPNMVFSNGVYYVKIKKDATTTIKKLIVR